jgi:CHASE3 domain sensor protein
MRRPKAEVAGDPIMNKLSLKMKLGMGFGGVLLILILTGIVANNAVGQLDELSNRVEKMMAKKDMASLLEAGVEKQSTGIRGFLLSGRDDSLLHDEEGKKEFSENMEKLRQTIVTEEGKRLHGEIQQNYAEYRSI